MVFSASLALRTAPAAAEAALPRRGPGGGGGCPAPPCPPAPPPPPNAPQVTPAEYDAAQPDPIAAFSAPVAAHMNADHAESTAAMIKHYAGISGALGDWRCALLAATRGCALAAGRLACCLRCSPVCGVGAACCPLYAPVSLAPPPPHTHTSFTFHRRIPSPPPPPSSGQGDHPAGGPPGHERGLRARPGPLQGAPALPPPRHRPQVDQGPHRGDDAGLGGVGGGASSSSGGQRQQLAHSVRSGTLQAAMCYLSPPPILFSSQCNMATQAWVFTDRQTASAAALAAAPASPTIDADV